MNTVAQHELIIIGGGASGTVLAWNLSRRLGRPVSLIDPGEIMGQGLAYATPSLGHILNVPAGGMSASVTDSGHFLAWLQRRINPRAEAADFVPRSVYGQYLRELALESGVMHIRARVQACQPWGEGWQLTLEDGRQLEADQVVLALGHHAPSQWPGCGNGDIGLPQYAADAWQDALYSAVRPEDRVVLVGTGLTMVDALVRLRQRGHEGKVVAVSGHGLLPQRHAPYVPRDTPAIEPGREVAATARDYLRAFHQALQAGSPWRAVVDSLRPVSNRLWQALPAVEKRRFKRHLQRRWDVLRHRMAPQIADQLEAEVAAGQLEVVAGRVVALESAGRQIGLHLQCKGAQKTLMADKVINCSGPCADYRRSGTPLLRSMLEAGIIAPGFGGKGLACDEDGRLYDSQGKVAAGLHVIGPARLGLLFESSAMPEIKQQAHALAERIAPSLALEDTLGEVLS